MKNFKIYQKVMDNTGTPVSNSEIYEPVKDGWSWPGAIFGIFWMMYKKMWAYAAGIFGATFALYFLLALANVSEETINVVNMITNIFFLVLFGYFGNRIYEHFLIKKGYKYIKTVSASSPQNALVIFQTSR